MRKELVLLLLFTVLFSGCLLPMFETNTPKKMSKKLHKKEVWEIRSLHVTEYENTVKVADTSWNNPGYFQFLKKEDEDVDSYISKTGNLTLQGKTTPIQWRCYAPDNIDETPNLIVLFLHDLAHFEKDKDYEFSNRLWNEEDQLHLEWKEVSTTTSGIVDGIIWELKLVAKEQ